MLHVHCVCVLLSSPITGMKILRFSWCHFQSVCIWGSDARAGLLCQNEIKR